MEPNEHRLKWHSCADYVIVEFTGKPSIIGIFHHIGFIPPQSITPFHIVAWLEGWPLGELELDGRWDVQVPGMPPLLPNPFHLKLNLMDGSFFLYTALIATIKEPGIIPVRLHVNEEIFPFEIPIREMNPHE